MEEKTKLEMCAEEIHKLQLDILDRESNLAQEIKKAAFIEAEMKEKIANEMGADGKPLYSNDAKRAAALLNMSFLMPRIVVFLNLIKKAKEQLRS